MKDASIEHGAGEEFQSFPRQGSSLIGRKSIGISGFAEKSLLSHPDSVFLTWHNIEFMVPIKRETKNMTTKQRARADWIEKHQIRASQEKTGGEVNMKAAVTTTQDVSHATENPNG